MKQVVRLSHFSVAAIATVNALLSAALPLLPLAGRRRGVQSHIRSRTANRRFGAHTIAFLTLLSAAPISAAQLFELHASDGAGSDQFGVRVALRGNRAVIGAKSTNINSALYDTGAAYVFDATTGQQLFKLTASDPSVAATFGSAVALTETRALIGADSSAGLTSTGAAYLFDLANGQQLRKFTPSDPNGNKRFGSGVALSDTRALIGAQNSSSAYIFNVNTGQQLLKLAPTDETSFGSSVAMSGDIALIGALQLSGPGAAYLFNMSTGQQLFKLTASDPGSNSRFGWSVALNDSIALVGAPFRNAAYVFDLATGQQLMRLTTPDGNTFGSSVALNGNLALIGDDFDHGSSLTSGAGAAYVFDMTTGQQIAKLTAADGALSDFFGASVAMSGKTALVGAWGTDDRGSASGSAYLFDLTVPEPSTAVLAMLALVPFFYRRRAVRNRGCPLAVSFRFASPNSDAQRPLVNQ